MTPYTRVVRIHTGGPNPNEVRVTSTVTWRTGSISDQQTVVAETYLYNTI
jgi:hypothetical protein